MFKTLTGVTFGVVLATGVPRAWRFVAARSNTQVHRINS